MRTLTIRLEATLLRQLDRMSRQLGRSRGEIVREALRRQLGLVRFEETRRQLLPFGEAHGYLTDDDVLNGPRLSQRRSGKRWKAAFQALGGAAPDLDLRKP